MEVSTEEHDGTTDVVHVLYKNKNSFADDFLDTMIEFGYKKTNSGWEMVKYSDIDKADKWFDTKGNKTVFFCRFIPIVRSLISIPAGMSEMPIIKFLTYTIFGSLIWNTVLIITGKMVGNNWTKILTIFYTYSHIVLIIFIIIFIILITIFYKKRKNNKI